jgi:hypothetical protein
MDLSSNLYFSSKEFFTLLLDFVESRAGLEWDYGTCRDKYFLFWQVLGVLPKVHQLLNIVAVYIKY